MIKKLWYLVCLYRFQRLPGSLDLLALPRGEFQHIEEQVE